MLRTNDRLIRPSKAFVLGTRDWHPTIQCIYVEYQEPTHSTVQSIYIEDQGSIPSHLCWGQRIDIFDHPSYLYKGPRTDSFDKHLCWGLKTSSFDPSRQHAIYIFGKLVILKNKSKNEFKRFTLHLNENFFLSLTFCLLIISFFNLFILQEWMGQGLIIKCIQRYTRNYWT